MKFNYQGMAAAVGGAVGALLVAAPAQAQEQFGNASILFEADTVVEFQFLESEAYYQSTFGVENLETGERTPLIREADGRSGQSTEFQFRANTRYAFYLESFLNGQPAGMFYSIDGQNPNGARRLEFDGSIAQLGEGGVVLRWDDTGSLLVAPPLQDEDFNDFVVRAGGHLACPFSDETAIAPGAAPQANRC